MVYSYTFLFIARYLSHVVLILNIPPRVPFLSERVVMVKIQAKPFDNNLIQVYAPTSDHSDNKIEAFYDEIEATLKYTRSSEITMLMGDFNAKVGNMKEFSITGKYGIGVRNERGNRLVEFCKGKELTIMNTMYQHHVRTYTYGRALGTWCATR